MAAQDARAHQNAVRQLAARQIAPEIADRDLLDRFSGRMDESAFEILVRRHAGLVLATARRVLGNAHDAEDVCQAAFLLLARKAASRRWQPSVASWLHRTAHHLALKARTASARRARREERAPNRPPADPLDELTGRELLQVLDEELLALPESLRAPLVLCYLQGATRDEAAARLGCPLSTLKKRLERGRGRLHAALAQRGLGLSAGLLSTLVSREGAAAISAAFVRLIASNALGLVIGGPGDGGISPRVGQLIHGGMGMVVRRKIKAGLGVLLVGGLLSAAALSAGTEKPASQPKDEAAGAKPALPAAPAAGRSMRVVVLDPDGKPVSGAKVQAWWSTEKSQVLHDKRELKTDAAGAVRVELPPNFTGLQLRAGKKPWTTLYAGWSQSELFGAEVPAEYTFRLQPAAMSRGRVVDEQGKPIAGARVEARLANAPRPPGNDSRIGYWSPDESATTDADGAWQIGSVPSNPETELSLNVTHPDFVSGWQGNVKASRNETITLKRGVVVHGRVTDSDGAPVKNAVVVAAGEGDRPTDPDFRSETDADGRYRLPARPAGKAILTVVAAGRAPQTRTIEVRENPPAQEFRLSAGKSFRLRVVDKSGKPITGATVTLQRWKGSDGIYWLHRLSENGLAHRAGAGGVWVWPTAPDEPVKARVEAKGYVTSEITLELGKPEQTVTLQTAYQVSGSVTDTLTGKPIPMFTVTQVDILSKAITVSERSGNLVAGSNGKLEFVPTRTDTPLRLRVEAPGYRTQDGPEFRVGDDAKRTQNFRLQPSPPLTGVVLGLDGRPAARVEVLLATPTEEVQILSRTNAPLKTVTDDSGRFAFRNPGERCAIVVETDAGIAIEDVPADRLDIGTMKLRPWGSIRGQYRDGGKPVADCPVGLEPIRLYAIEWPRLMAREHVTTDSEGRFEFRRVPPGPVTVHAVPNPRWKEKGLGSAPSVPLDVRPGARIDVDLGSGGAAVSGKVKLTGPVPAGLTLTSWRSILVRRAPGVTPPSNFAVLGFDIRKGYDFSWGETHEGSTYLRSIPHWFVVLGADGSFRINGVPPGEYDLAISISANPTGLAVGPLARRVVRVTVTAADVTRGELAVPEIAAEVRPTLAVGDTPALAFERTDGTAGRLADYRGKYTVVHFWAHWYVQEKGQIPALHRLHDRFAARGLATLGLALGGTSSNWRTSLNRLEIPWPQGLVTSDTEQAVCGVHTFWLLDPAGKIVAATSDVDELAKEIEGRLKEMPKDR